MPDLSSVRRLLSEADPDDRDLRRVLAESFDTERHASDPRGAVLRAAADVHERVGGVILPDRLDAFWTESPGWDAVARELESLAAHPEPTHAFRRRYERLIRGDVPLTPEDLEATLRLQYDLHVQMLWSLDLLEKREGQPGITAVDGKWYPLPPFDDILTRLDEPALRRKLSQGFDTLLLVPFGLPLGQILDAWRDGLRRNAPLLRSVGQFDENNPLYVWDGYSAEPLVYDPRNFTADHGGRTKAQLLTGEHRGWDVLLTEGALVNLPEIGQGRSVGGRQQLACGWSPEWYLEELRDRGETGLTPEAYTVAFLDALDRRGQVLDHETATLLVGAYLPSPGGVPDAYWNPMLGSAQLGAGDLGDRYDDGSARAAVRVG